MFNVKWIETVPLQSMRRFPLLLIGVGIGGQSGLFKSFYWKCENLIALEQKVLFLIFKMNKNWGFSADNLDNSLDCFSYVKATILQSFSNILELVYISSKDDLRFIVECICSSVSPNPSIIEVLEITSGWTFLACFKTHRDCSKLARGSRTFL